MCNKPTSVFLTKSSCLAAAFHVLCCLSQTWMLTNPTSGQLTVLTKTQWAVTAKLLQHLLTFYFKSKLAI
jgi:hypothetical protein